jgi:hypothetical protein
MTWRWLARARRWPLWGAARGGHGGRRSGARAEMRGESWSLLHDANQPQSLSASDTLMNWHRAHLCRCTVSGLAPGGPISPPKAARLTSRAVTDLGGWSTVPSDRGILPTGHVRRHCFRPIHTCRVGPQIRASLLHALTAELGRLRSWAVFFPPEIYLSIYDLHIVRGRSAHVCHLSISRCVGTQLRPADRAHGQW